MMEAMKERDEKSKQKIENLYSEIKHLRGLIDQGNSISAGQNSTVNELITQKDTLVREKESLLLNLNNTKNELTSALEKNKILESESVHNDTSIKELKFKIADLEEKKAKEIERQKKFQDELENLKKQLDDSVQENNKKDRDIDKFNKEVADLNTNKRDLEKEKETKSIEIKHLTAELEDHIMTIKIQRHQSQEVSKKVHDLEFNITTLRTELNEKVTKISQQALEIDKIKKERDMLKNQKGEVERELEVTLAVVQTLERAIQETRKLAFEDQKVLDGIKHTREFMNKELNRAENANNKQKNELVVLQKSVLEKDTEIGTLKTEIERKNQKITSLEREKEKYGINAAQANAKYFHCLEEIKLKDNLISEFQKKNIETEAKLKQQQNLYEAVRSDRNLYSKNLTETQDEIAEIKRRYKIVSHQISQLKEEIDSKESALTKEHFDLKQAEKKCEELNHQIDKLQNEMGKKEERIKAFINEIGKLQFIIRESEGQRRKLKEEYETVIGERDILGTQLIRKNDELALLYEKIKIQQSTLAKGEAQYMERLNDIEILRNKLRDQYRALKIANKQADSIPELKNEIHNLQKELIEEKLKVRGLSDELENPMNVHRWRKLEGTDADTFEMITKIQTLQKRLIAKTEEVVERDVIVEQKDKAIQELREMMKRAPTVEDAKMISEYQNTLRQKTRQMKAMAAEMNMYQHQVNEYKSEVDRLTRDMQETKRKYFEMKRRDQANKENVDRQVKFY